MSVCPVSMQFNPEGIFVGIMNSLVLDLMNQAELLCYMIMSTLHNSTE